MLNIPVAGGTSGHMLGGVLVAVFLGPFAASIVMATVFIVQTKTIETEGGHIHLHIHKHSHEEIERVKKKYDHHFRCRELFYNLYRPRRTG